MRKAFSIVLILIICCQFSKEAFFLTWFHLNRATFTEQFCVNIDRPELDCHGQCKMDEVLDDFSAPRPAKDQIQAPKSLSNLKVLNNSFLWAGFFMEKNEQIAPEKGRSLRTISVAHKIFRPPIPA